MGDEQSLKCQKGIHRWSVTARINQRGKRLRVCERCGEATYSRKVAWSLELEEWLSLGLFSVGAGTALGGGILGMAYVSAIGMVMMLMAPVLFELSIRYV